MFKNRLMQLFKDNADKQHTPVKGETVGEEATLYLYDAIGDWYGLSAKDFIKELSGITADTIHLRINCPGGDVFDARAIATALAQCGKKVISHIDGVCASAATYIALAANEVEMAQGSFFMIHNAWTLAMGNSSDMRSMADLLDKIDGTIVNDYCNKTGKKCEEVQQMMADETWMTADEALAHGFIDCVYDGEEVANKWNLSAYDKTPVALMHQDKPVVPIAAYDRERFERRIKLTESIA